MMFNKTEKLQDLYRCCHFTNQVGPDGVRFGFKLKEGIASTRNAIKLLEYLEYPRDYELDGLVTREMDGHKIILPIWHMISKDQVINYSPTLADKIALNSSSSTIDEIVAQLSEAIKGKQQ